MIQLDAQALKQKKDHVKLQLKLKLNKQNKPSGNALLVQGKERHFVN